MSLRSIRPLQKGDIAALQAMDEVAHGQAWSQRTFDGDIDSSDRVHFVAEQDREIVGHAAGWIDGSSYRVTNVATLAARTGQGHASALLHELLQHAIATSGVTNVQLEVRPANRRAQRLYGRFGFVPVGIERNFYDRRDDQGSTDALVMAIADVYSEAWRQRLTDLQTTSVLDSPSDAGAAA